MFHRRIIKQGPVVLATQEDGTMNPTAPASHGLFLADTRFLSLFQIRLNDMDLVLLGSSEEILFEASFLFTNQEMSSVAGRGLGILQRNQISAGAVHFHITVANWSLHPVECELSIEVEADFFDSFEARGVKRLKRGETMDPKITSNTVDLEYRGLDAITRTTRISTTPDMGRFENNRMYFPVKLEVGERKLVRLDLKMEEKAPEGVSLQPAPEIERVPKPEWFDEATRISVTNSLVQSILDRSIDDLEVLMMHFSDAWVPAAGLPRFAVPFGRDCIITGLQTLAWNHHLSRDVLRFLAKRQGKEINPWNYEEPGKILHELHTGELARLNEIPFGLFYGSVDSTPLFLVLGAEYIRWTGDLEFFHEMKPHFDAAWNWIDKYGDIDGSGYIQYKAHTPPKVSAAALTVGLFNQGWKDSATAVMYSTGEIVTKHPVALAEVQGALFRALELWADIYDCMPEREGMKRESVTLQRRAEKLREQFNREFWMADKGYYAMGLDGDHNQVDSITSNPGHCLWSRLIDEEHADAVAQTLLGERMFTEWGIRTMASTEAGYNPFSYHNGSVWPFENSLISSGLKKYGYVLETQRLFEAMVDASLYFEYRRWPEVYCGVSRAIGGVLARQPDASRPQAWSSGAIFMFIQTILGIAARPFSKHIDLTPALPAGVNEVLVEDLWIAGSTLSLRLIREHNSVLLEIRDNPGNLDIVIHPATYQPRQKAAASKAAASG